MNSMAESIGLAPVRGKQYKLFLVELDDEDRERVLSGQVGHCVIDVEPQFEDVYSFDSFSSRTFKTHQEVTVTLKLVPNEDGTYFRIENFNEPEEEPYEAPVEWDIYE